MEVLLLSDITGVGRKNDLIVVKSGYALNHLLPERRALVVTPNVRRRYALQIKQRAVEREKEREVQLSLSAALANKTVHLMAKASKPGKLYAAITEKQIAELLRTEYGINITEESITIAEHIKAVGTHTVTVTVGAQSTTIKVEVKPEGAPAKAA